jgi:ligand-binding sensor domain-containing protein/AraC-like DNA-binding protein
MTRSFPSLTAIILFLLFSFSTYCQADRFYSSDQLSSSMISAASIAQDAEGYIWIGTEYGLNRFDGYQFVNFLHDPSNAATVGYNLISTLLCEDSGQTWVGTAKGLDLYDPRHLRFLHFAFPGGLRPRVSRIIRLRNGRLLAGTAGYGLYLVHEESRRLERIHHFTSTADDEFYSNLFEDSRGKLWKCDATNGITCNMPFSRRSPRRFVSPIGTPMAFAERDGEVLVLCLHGMLVFRHGKMEVFPLTLGTPDSQNIVFRSLHADRKGNLYIGTRGHGLFCLPPHSFLAKRVESQNTNVDLNSSKVWSIFDDREGNLWVGCQQKGLLMIPGKRPYFESWSFSAQKQSLGTPITAICEGDEGLIWCSVQGNGIYGFNAQGRIVRHPTSPPDVEFIYRDKKKNYWLGTDDGLFSYSPLSGKYKLISQFDCDKFNDLAEDENGNIYISTFSRGFCRYNTLTRQFKNYNSSMLNARKGQLCNNWIHAMLPDKEGLIWLATATGISCYNPQTDSFRSLGWLSLLNGMMCYSLCELPNGDILIGTELGLYVYRRHEKKVERHLYTHQLENKVISYIVCENDGSIWCSTSSGIWYYQAKAKNWIGYINGNGLSNREYVVNAGLHTDAGLIYFGTADGITAFNPHVIRTRHDDPGRVQLTSFMMADQHYATQGTTTFRIPYQTNSFSMEFSLMNYTDAENTTFEYRLQNHSDWTSLTTGQNVIKFNHLASGTYQLSVRACVNGGYSPVSSYTFVVTAPWYKSVWAYILYILLGILSIIGLIYLYIRGKRRKLDEEKMKFLINATHDIRSPLTLIMSPLAKLKQRRNSPEDIKELGLIEHNTKRILGLVNQILDVRKFDKQQMRLQVQETDLVQYINGIFRMYTYNAAERNIEYTYHHPETPVKAWIDHSQFDKVIGNLLSNAFKYTLNGGHIALSISQNDEKTIQISVTDDGIGIKEEDRKRVFDRFYQSRQTEDAHLTGTGIGLNLCKMIVEMHHGQIEALAGEEGKGSSFVARIPAGKEHLRPDELVSPSDSTAPVHKPRPNTHYRILFVDDDASLCDYIQSELGRYYHISCCHNGREAVRILLSQSYDLVVSDVMMPEMDGFTLLRVIKKNPEINHIPVIMLTSKADIANRLEGLEQGADAFMAKPFTIHELHVLINSLINNVLRLKGKFSGAQQQKDKLKMKESKGNDEAFMDRVMQVISQHMEDNDLNVELLAEKTGISRTHLQRKLKEQTGLSAGEFIRNLRLEQAARLLQERKFNVSQVAYAVGFNNLAHFSTVFKKHFGMTPTEYMDQKR